MTTTESKNVDWKAILALLSEARLESFNIVGSPVPLLLEALSDLCLLVSQAYEEGRDDETDLGSSEVRHPEVHKTLRLPQLMGDKKPKQIRVSRQDPLTYDRDELGNPASRPRHPVVSRRRDNKETAAILGDLASFFALLHMNPKAAREFLDPRLVNLAKLPDPKVWWVRSILGQAKAKRDRDAKSTKSGLSPTHVEISGGVPRRLRKAKQRANALRRKAQRPSAKSKRQSRR